MKVLYYIHSLTVGGAETIVTNCLLALKRQGVDVVLVEIKKQNTFLEERLKEAGIRTVALLPTGSYSLLGKVKRKLLRWFTVSARWREILREEKPDVIHVHTFAHLLGRISFPAERMVCTIHSDVERNLRLGGEGHRRVLQKLADGGMTFFALSDQAADDIRERLHTDRIVYVPNGVDLSGIRASRYQRADVLPELGVPQDAFVVGHVGRFHPVKNHEKLLSVFAAVAKRCEKAYLLLIGTGDAEQKARVDALIAQHDLQGRVICLGLRSDATALMGVLDAFVLPSLSESFSLVLIEAQAHGVRCVASTAVPERVACTPGCFRLPLEASDESWAELILSDSTEEKQANIEDFDMHTVLARMCEAYRRIIQGNVDGRG